MDTTIRFGLYDWTKFSSQTGFYPEDLPASWRLSYFSNEFDSAVIKLTDFTKDLGQLLESVEDLPQSFELSFILENVKSLELLYEYQEQSDVPVHSVLLTQEDSKLIAGLEVIRVPVVLIDSIWTPSLPQSGSQMALFPAKQTMRTYRNWIELWVGGQKDKTRELSLWLPAEEAGYVELRDLKTLIELMGY